MQFYMLFHMNVTLNSLTKGRTLKDNIKIVHIDVT